MQRAFHWYMQIILMACSPLCFANTPLAKHLVHLPEPHFFEAAKSATPSSFKTMRVASNVTKTKQKITPVQTSSKHAVSEQTPVAANHEAPKATHAISLAEANKLRTAPTRSILRVHDCLLTATLYTGNWHVECMRTGSTNEESWQMGWQPTPMARKAIPQTMWAVCSWLNGFGYNELTTTPDLGIDPRLGNISRRKNVFLYNHGYEVSGGSTIITRLGRHCPIHGKSVKRAPKKSKDWTAYLDFL